MYKRQTLRCLLGIDFLCDLAKLLGQGVGCHLDHFDIRALERFLDLVDLSFDRALFVGRYLVAQIGQSLFRLEDQLLCAVADIDFFLTLFIFGSELFSFVHCLVDLFLREVGGRRNGDLLLLTGAQILGRYVYDAVSVDVEGNFDLRYTTRSRSNADVYKRQPRRGQW